MGSANVLLIERTHGHYTTTYTRLLRKRYLVVTVSSGKQAVAVAHDHRPSTIILDAISMQTFGGRICRQLKRAFPNIPLIHLHPGNSTPTTEGAEESCADVVLYAPISARKLVNAVARLHQSDRVLPMEDGVIAVGPFTLAIAERLLTVDGEEYRLTPKTAMLLQLFLRYEGETLRREQLMEQVWQTQYLGDTRTLDVHIRWLRRIIEENPNEPRYLKTVRGVGYRFEIPRASPAAAGV